VAGIGLLRTVPAEARSVTAGEQLIPGILAGDEAAIEGLRRLVSRLCRRADEDDVQEAFVSTWRAVVEGRLRNRQALGGYAVIAVRNLQLQRMAREKRERETEVEWQPPVRTPEQTLLTREHARRMRDALARLRPIDREILKRSYLDEQDADEICAAMRLDAMQFHRARWRARERLAALLRGRAAQRAETTDAELIAQIREAA
jgi:RNA polymerase sigma factor (sigma-70 family)